MSNAQRVQCWELESFRKLEEILGLFSLDYRYEEYDLEMNPRWIAPNNNQDLIRIKDVDGQQIKFIYLTAEVDILKVDTDKIHDVPFDVAFDKRQINVIFVETNGSINVLASGPSVCMSKLRKRLMKFWNNRKENRWGKINCKKDVLKKTHFFWIMSNINKQLRLGTEEYSLLDVEGFKCFVENTLQNYNGDGQGLTGQVPVQTMVSLDNNFSGLNFVIESEENYIDMGLTNNYEIMINGVSHRKVNGQNIFFDNIDIILKIYYQILPGIIENYNRDRGWKIRESNFKKEYGLKAILGIMNVCDLTTDDIDNANKKICKVVAL